jgi:phosphotransferase system, enzyme I, PtsP
MPTRFTGPLVLLRELRETMAATLGAQARLDRIVDLIAQNMRADVCSFYVLRDDGALELFATHGLKREAVHMTSLRSGEGLVGLIAAGAQPLNLTDAPAHPAFAYRPETGEDPYTSFLGVPVLRAGQTLGVLVVQARARGSFQNDETEALLTVATLLAEMISTSEFDNLVTPGSDIDLRRARTFEGAGFAEGIALGHVVLHDPRVVVTNFVAEDIEAEKARLDKAIRTLRLSIDTMFSTRDIKAGSEHHEILESYRMFANDRGWVRRLGEAVDQGLTAEAAVERVQNDTRARMLRQADPYIRDRLHDLDDLANRLLRVLTGDPGVFQARELAEDAVLVARNLGPAELLEYDRSRLRAIVIEEGGPTSHVAIVARSLGLVAVGQAQNITAMCENGDDIIVDGATGRVHLRPPPGISATYIEKMRVSVRRRKRFAAQRDTGAVTRDGIKITLLHNSGLLADLPALKETGASGVGLFRTELQFMIASRLPRMKEQTELYAQALDSVGDKPIIFRLLDIGGDKVVPFLRSTAEENPAMGWRSLRLAFDRLALMRTQVRALLQASRGRPLHILVPMITEVTEFAQARVIIDKEVAWLKRNGGTPPRSIAIGAMIEVPSILFELDRLMPLTDFVSIGSNDLVQFLTAADRANPKVSKRYDAIGLARLRAMHAVVAAADAHDVPVTMCGELAGRPIEALALMAIGIERLSMAASSVGPVKELIVAAELAPIRDRVLSALKDSEDPTTMRELLIGLAESQNLPL